MFFFHQCLFLCFMYCLVNLFDFLLFCYSLFYFSSLDLTLWLIHHSSSKCAVLSWRQNLAQRDALTPKCGANLPILTLKFCVAFEGRWLCILRPGHNTLQQIQTRVISSYTFHCSGRFCITVMCIRFDFLVRDRFKHVLSYNFHGRGMSLFTIMCTPLMFPISGWTRVWLFRPQRKSWQIVMA